jgi:hypothetical protein
MLGSISDRGQVRHRASRLPAIDAAAPDKSRRLSGAAADSRPEYKSGACSAPRAVWDV